MLKTNTLYRDNTRATITPKPVRDKNGKDYLKLFGIIGKSMKWVVIIPCDPNALLERLELLLAGTEAGHTGVGNELVSKCDELKRQVVLDSSSYKKKISIIKK